MFSFVSVNVCEQLYTSVYNVVIRECERMYTNENKKDPKDFVGP